MPAQAPMEVFESNRPAMERHDENVRVAQEAVDAAAAKLSAAEGVLESRKYKRGRLISSTLGQIYEAAEAGGDATDTPEYIRAYLNTGVPGRCDVGQAVADGLHSLQDLMLERPTPVAVIDADRYTHDSPTAVIFGLAVGKLAVHRAQDHEGFMVRQGLVLDIPMVARSSYVQSRALSLGEDPLTWQYESPSINDEPILQTVRHYLPNLQTAGNLDQLALTEDDYARVQFDTNEPRQCIAETGYRPAVVFGEAAITALLRRLASGEGLASHRTPPEVGDIAAAAITLGLDPETVLGPDFDHQQAIREKFSSQTQNAARRLVRNEMFRRQYGHWVVGQPPLIATSRPIFEHLGVSVSDLSRFAEAGLVEVEDALCTSFQDDIASEDGNFEFWSRHPEHRQQDCRLTLSEAASLIASHFNKKYGTNIAPVNFVSEAVQAALEYRLDELRFGLLES